jgi:hypothetical protein
MIVSLVLCTAMTWAGFSLCNLAIHRFTRSLLLSTLPIAGAYWLAIGAVFHNHDYWQLIDGMESGASLLTGGLVLYILARRLTARSLTLCDLTSPTWANPFMPVGLVLPFLILARLDDVFILPALAIGVFLLPGEARRKAKTAALLVSPATVALVVYVTYNRLTVGTWLPLSGMTKSGISAPLSTYVLASGLLPPLIDAKNAIASHANDVLYLHENMFRVTQLIYPALFAVAYIFHVLCYRRQQARYVAPMVLAGYVIFKAAYNYVNVNLWHQGTWYYAFSMMLASFFVAVLLAEPYRRLEAHGPVRAVLGGFLALSMLFSAGAAAMQKAGAPESTEYRICRDAVIIDRALDERAPGEQVIEFDDGALGFCLDHHVMHGFGFATDLASFGALRDGHLLAHARARHYDLFATAYPMPFTERQGSAAIRAVLHGSYLEDAIEQEVDRFDWEVVYVHPASGVAFIRFTPRDAHPPHAARGARRST